MSECIDKHFNQIIIGGKTLCAICLNEQNERLINENAQLLAENTVQWRDIADLRAKLKQAEWYEGAYFTQRAAKLDLRAKLEQAERDITRYKNVINRQYLRGIDVIGKMEKATKEHDELSGKIGQLKAVAVAAEEALSHDYITPELHESLRSLKEGQS